MGNLLKRIWASAPIWAWVVMIVCVIVLVVGLVVSGNRTSSASSSTPVSAAPSSVAPASTPSTVAFMDAAKASPETPKTLVLLGDSTGSNPKGWAPALGSAISSSLDRPVATKYWNVATGRYGPMVGLGEGKNGAVGFWNGSAAGKDAAYAQQNLDELIRPEVTPDLILLNFGRTQDQSKPLATQVQPLVDDLQKKYSNAKIAVIKQSPDATAGAGSSDELSVYAAAMDAEGIQVIDVYSAFPSDSAGRAALVDADGNPNEASQKLWTKTVLTAFGLPST